MFAGAYLHFLKSPQLRGRNLWTEAHKFLFLK